MRRTQRGLCFVVLGAALLGACGSGDDDQVAEAGSSSSTSTTSTTTTTTTTIPEPTLSMDARRAVLLCVDAQSTLARHLDEGDYDGDDADDTDVLCDQAHVYIDTEARRGPHGAQLIALKLRSNSYDLALWGAEVVATGAPKSPSSGGLRPFDAAMTWRSEIDEMLDELPPATD